MLRKDVGREFLYFHRTPIARLEAKPGDVARGNWKFSIIGGVYTSPDFRDPYQKHSNYYGRFKYILTVWIDLYFNLT